MELEAEVKLLQIKQKARQYATPLFVISAAIIVLTILGLLGPMIPYGYKLTAAAIYINGLLLGLAFVGILAVGIGAADILQHILPEKMKGSDIETKKALKIAGTIIAAILAMLLVPYTWNFEGHPTLYVIVTTLLLIGAFTWFSWGPPKAAIAIILLFFIPTRGGQLLGWNILYGIYDGYELGNPLDPDYAAYQKWRDQRRDAETRIAGQIPATTPDPEAYVQNNLRSAQNIRAYREGEARIQAEAEGRTVPSGITPSVEAHGTGWTDVLSANGKQASLFAGQMICASGKVTNRMLTEHDRLIEVGPNGINLRQIDGYTPFDGRFPMMAMLGRINDSYVFPIPEGCHPAPASGQHFQVIVNNPYYEEHGWPAPGMASNKSNGRFVFTLAEPATGPRSNNYGGNQTPMAVPQVQHKSVYKKVRVSP